MQELINVQSRQKIENISGGTVIGVQIQELALRGSLIIRPPKDQAPQPPKKQIVQKYLESTQMHKMEAELLEASKRLVSMRESFRSQAARDDQQMAKVGKTDLQPKSPDSIDVSTSGTEKSVYSLDQQIKEVVELIKPLWLVPFRVRRADKEKSEPLYTAIQTIFKEGLEHGGNQRLVLLADPGMSKTPALREVRRQCAEESLTNSPDNWVIPFYIKLADLRSGQSLATLLSDAFEDALTRSDNRLSNGQPVGADQMIGLLEKYTCLFLFDDLDELLSTQQQGELQSLAYFMEKYKEHRYVVTCRTSSYRQQLGSLHRLYLDGLAQEDVMSVLHVNDQEYKRLKSTSPQLVANRLMLESYIVFDKSSDLVRAKGRFLQFLMHYRLERDKEIYSKHNVDSRIIAPLLEYLAINLRVDHTHDCDELKLMQLITTYLERWHESCSWRQVLSALQQTEILDYDDERRSWRFHDRVDEALFTANAVVQGQITHQALLAEVPSYWWRDVFEILVGLTPQPEQLLMDIMDKDPFTAANCFQYVEHAVSDAIEEALIDSLQERMSLESSTRRKFIVERIGQCAKPRAIEALLQVLYRDWSSMVVMATVKALLAWIQRYPADPDIQLETIHKAERKVTHSIPGPIESVVDLLRLYPRDGCVGEVEELCEKLKDPHFPSRFRGLTALGLGYANTKLTKNQAADALLEIIKDEQADDFVAWCAVEALIQLSQQSTASLQKRIAKRGRWHFDHGEEENKDDSRSRARVIYVLGWLTEGQKTGELMREALYNENPFVRGYVVEAMARRDIKDTRQTIEKLLGEEKHPFVLRRAVEALGQLGTLETILLLEKYLRSKQIPTRWSARAAIDEILERNALQ